MYEKKHTILKQAVFCAVLFIFYTPFTYAKLLLIETQQKSYPIENKHINESSGLACSTRDKHLLWTHNDSGHMPIIYAMSNKAKTLGTFYLDGVESYDWEDMDAFIWQGKHYLLIADTGDNYQMRFNYQLILIKEPKLKKQGSSLSPQQILTYQFADNKSYDVESVAVDVKRNKILLLTKRTQHAYLFEVPLLPTDPDKTQTAVKVAEFKDIVHPSAMDISADGLLLSINTYRRIHRFYRRSLTDTWHYRNSLTYKKLFQPEAMCLRKDGKYYYVSSEKKSFLLKIKEK